MALNGLLCADVPLRNHSLTHSRLICQRLTMFRYFKCAPLHGLFAPLHKVTSLSATVATPRRASLLHNAAGLVSSQRTNSQESLSSIGSTSSVSRRMRLGVMSLSGHVSIKSLRCTRTYYVIQ